MKIFDPPDQYDQAVFFCANFNSERLTKDWKGAPEANVHASHGVYKKKTSTSGGYRMLFEKEIDSIALSDALRKPYQ